MRLPIQVQGILFRKINGEIQYLLRKRQKQGFWPPVTGGIEEGEKRIEALKREVSEETGIKNVVRIIENVHYDERARALGISSLSFVGNRRALAPVTKPIKRTIVPTIE